MVYRALDLFYFPSITEGQPNALIEAILSGVPFIASNIQPIKEIIPEKFQDYLLEADDIENTIEKINKIQTMPEDLLTCEIKNWASNQFNPIVNFNKHKQLLNG
jgi:glycosyltransferase involved in cell wall biosynthesis